jgi:hypothetical protein
MLKVLGLILILFKYENKQNIFYPRPDDYSDES